MMSAVSDSVARGELEVSSFLEELRSVGIDISEMRQLANLTTVAPASTVQLIVDWLPRWSNPDAAKWTLYAMTRPWAINVAPLLPDIVRNLAHDPAQRAIAEYAGSALLGFSGTYTVETLVELIEDTSLGLLRIYPFEALIRRSSQRQLIRDTVLRFVDDEDVASSVMRAAARYRISELREVALQRADHPLLGIRDPSRLLLRRLSEADAHESPEPKPVAVRTPRRPRPRSDWYRNTSWSEEIAREFEGRLRRAHLENRAQYLRLQGVLLDAQRDPELQAVGRAMFERVVREYANVSPSDVREAKRDLAESLRRDAKLGAAEFHLRELLESRNQAQNSVVAELDVELQLAEVLLARGAEPTEVEAMLELAEQQLTDVAFLPKIAFRMLLCRARLAEITGDTTRAGALAREALAAAGTDEHSTNLDRLLSANPTASDLQTLWRLAEEHPDSKH